MGPRSARSRGQQCVVGGKVIAPGCASKSGRVSRRGARRSQALVVVLAVTSVEVFLITCTVWRLLRNRRMRRDFELIEEREANAIEALRKTAMKAQLKWDTAKRDLEDAREACLSAHSDVAVVEREGVSFHQAVKVGRHYIQRLSSAASSWTSDCP